MALDNDLVDEITLLTFPVVVGQGTRLFPDTGPDTALELSWPEYSTAAGAAVVRPAPGTSRQPYPGIAVEDVLVDPVVGARMKTWCLPG